MLPEGLKLTTVVDPMFAENTYIAHIGENRSCIVVDPGLLPEETGSKLTESGLTPHIILNTHGHSDHIAGNARLKEMFPDCPLVIGKLDAEKLLDSQLNLSAPFGVPFTSPPADRLVAEGDTVNAAGFELEVLETPGHSVGHVVYVWKAEKPWVVFGGDVLFQGGVGRSDFPDGSAEDLICSIREKLYPMPDDTIVLPGHGPATTIGMEKQSNPFVRG